MLLSTPKKTGKGHLVSQSETHAVLPAAHACSCLWLATQRTTCLPMAAALMSAWTTTEAHHTTTCGQTSTWWVQSLATTMAHAC
jgi:hypothetical protein